MLPAKVFSVYNRNCLVAEDLTVKISDFGMSRNVGTKGMLVGCSLCAGLLELCLDCSFRILSQERTSPAPCPVGNCEVSAVSQLFKEMVSL
jgi:hypothetical protein